MSSCSLRCQKESQVKDAVDACKSNFMSKEALELDQKCAQDFNAWYWAQQKLKEGKKYVSKAVGTCDSSINELVTKNSFEKFNNIYNKKDNGSETILVENVHPTRSVGVQVKISNAANAKDFDEKVEDDVNVKKVNAQGGSERKKSKKSKKKPKKFIKDTSDEEFEEFKKLEDTSDDDEEEVKVYKKIEDDDLDKTDAKVKGKRFVRNVKACGGYSKEPSTNDDRENDYKFKKRMVNDVKENDGDPEGDSVKKEARSHHSDVLGNILLVMQACFIVMCAKSCNGCHEMSKTLQSMGTHQEGWHIMDVYKPHKARMTVKSSSNCSNRYCYQFPTWTTDRSGLRGLMSQGRLSCKEVADLGKLTWKRLVKWTQLQLENLKGGARTARIGIARIVLWDQEVSRQLDVMMSKNQVAVETVNLEDSYEEKKC